MCSCDRRTCRQSAAASVQVRTCHKESPVLGTTDDIAGLQHVQVIVSMWARLPDVDGEDRLSFGGVLRKAEGRTILQDTTLNGFPIDETRLFNCNETS